MFIDNSAKTNWNVLGVVALLTVLVAGGAFVYSFQKEVVIQSSQIEEIAEPSSNAEEVGVIKLSGEVLRGEAFEKDISSDLVFRLIPGSGGIADWTISIEDKANPQSNFSGVVTPPFRGINHIYIAGWHLRNSDNSGPNELGPKNLNTPGKTRYFDFVLNNDDYEKAGEAVEVMMRGGIYLEEEKKFVPATEEEIEAAFLFYEEVPKGEGTLTIMDMTLGNLVIGEKAWIESMSFDVEFVFPQDMSDWQTYTNEEFGFELRYPEGLFVQDISDGADEVTLRFVQVDPESGENSLELFIGIDVNETSKMNLEEYEFNHMQLSTLGPYDAVRIFPDSPPYFWPGYILLSDKREYVLTHPGDILEEQILSTFRFTD